MSSNQSVAQFTSEQTNKRTNKQTTNRPQSHHSSTLIITTIKGFPHRKLLCSCSTLRHIHLRPQGKINTDVITDSVPNVCHTISQRNQYQPNKSSVCSFSSLLLCLANGNTSANKTTTKVCVVPFDSCPPPATSLLYAAHTNRNAIEMEMYTRAA